jgi:hypothetical protein
MGSPKLRKPAAIAATPRVSAIDIQRFQDDSADEMRRRRGFGQSTYAGETGMYNASSVLG